MTRKEYIANWLSNISVAVGISFMVSVILMVMDGKITPDNKWYYALFVVVSACVSFLFFAAGRAFLKDSDHGSDQQVPKNFEARAVVYSSPSVSLLDELLASDGLQERKRLRLSIEIS